jgi:hypothetical protein
MKKINRKKSLVDYMIENGNNFKYTDMIKYLVKVCREKEYEWQYDRGFYAANFSYNGYITRGCGTCGVYKNPTGKWSAKYYTEEEMMSYKIERLISPVVTRLIRYPADWQGIKKIKSDLIVRLTKLVKK